MSPRLHVLKIPALTLAGLFVAYLLFGWLVLPRIIQWQAEQYIAEKTGHRLSLDRPEFNPFDLSLRLSNLRLEEADGRPLLAFRELDVDLSAASLFHRAFVFDGIRLEQPQATVVLRPDGRLNWSPLIEALKGKQERPDSPLPRLDIRSFVLAGGRVDFADERAAFATRIEPLNLELSDISTLPDDQGRYQITARTAFGTRVLLRGEGEAYPLALAGHLGVENLDLARLAPYLKELLPTAPPAGVASLTSDYRLSYEQGKLGLTLDKLTAELKGLRLQAGRGPILTVGTIAAKNGSFDLARNRLALGSLSLANAGIELPRATGAPARPLQIASLGVEGLQADLSGRSVGIGRIVLKGGRLKAVRDARGRIDLVAAWQALPRPAAKPAPQPAGKPWHFKAGKLELSGFSAALRDEAVAPAAELAIDDIAVAIDHPSDDLKAPLPLRASFTVKSGGSFEAAGQVVPAGPSADLRLKLADLALKPAQPYLAAVAKLALAGGSLSVQGSARYGKPGASFKGGFVLRDLLLKQSDTGARFLALKSLSSRDLTATPAALAIGQLEVDGLDTSLLIAKDKSLNVSRILRPSRPVVAAKASGPVLADKHKAAPFRVNIARVRVSKGALNFADNSLTLPFGARIHHLRGVINGLSSRPGAPAQVQLDGQVDDYGLARASGQIDLFNPTGFTDLKVIFRNVEMTRLTPYAATFAGRKIDSGKLSLDLEYKIDQRQLTGQNKIIMDRLTLGERVKSPEAKDLPLDLAIAVLQDADGRIDLGLPVSGSLDDPQFSFGQIIWKAIVNVVGKIATAPFRALASLFGGSGEKFEDIAFEAGAARLTPPEREKLVRLAAALGKRPGLALTLHGVYADADRAALKDRQLRFAVAERAGYHVAGQEDPGPLAVHDPKVQAALEKLFAERFGAGELAALKQGFRQANPGQLKEGVAGKMMSALTGLLRQQRQLSAAEVAQLKGADFYTVLFGRLKERETVADERLLALARARGENAAAALKAAGAPADRLMLAAPEQVEAEGGDVPLKLALGAAAKTVAPAAPD
ncbi:AsmA family protein [mine drainage metagenome]|uniref:AsmA family protein n=1 Tax=mine drainage metagenome TaxID=410659 RepID=A0A1J5S899_9ZZZZ